ncbi:MAG: chloride channel protein [Planctomycetota bacterium]
MLALPTWKAVQAFGQRTDVGSVGKWVGLSGVIGVLGGLAAVAFDWLVHAIRNFGVGRALERRTEGLGGEVAMPWVVLVALPLGGLLVGLIAARFRGMTRKHGTEGLIDVFHNEGGRTSKSLPLVVGASAAITIGSGGSAGQEGPVALIGGGIGSSLAGALHLSDRERRIFLLAGSSAGIGALFTAPMGAALFAPEVLYRKPEFEGEAIVPCIIASIVAYTTFTTITGRERAIELPAELLANLSVGSPAQLLCYVALAILCALVGWLHVHIIDGITRLFAGAKRLPLVLRPALGGLVVASLALAIAPWCGDDGILFGGYDLMQSAIAGSLGLSVMAILVAAKIFGTAFTIGSGGTGGLFAPSLAIGALLGSIVGQAAEALFPELGIQPGAFALVGMGGFFAGVAKTPIAAILIVSEMTGGYALLAPLMLVSVLHLLFARKWSLYESQVESPVDSPAHTGDFVVDVLERVRVRELLDGARRPTLVHADTTLRRALEIVSTSSGYYFPVVDDADQLVGIFSLTDVRRMFQETAIADLVIVRDFMVENVVTTRPDATLSEALEALNEHGLHELPVVAIDDPRRVLAMLTRNNLGAAYHRRLHALRGG